MKEKHGNAEKLFDPIKTNKKVNFHFYLNWKCTNCGAQYGGQPSYCHACGGTNMVQTEPEYKSL